MLAMHHLFVAFWYVWVHHSLFGMPSPSTDSQDGWFDTSGSEPVRYTRDTVALTFPHD